MPDRPRIDPPRIDPEDELLCLGHEEDVAARDGALMAPIVPASLFAFPSSGALHDALAEEHRHAVYSRGRNPTVRALETTLARLEGGEEASLVASGMAAVSMALIGLLRSGDHVLFVNDIYGPAIELATRLRRFGIDHDRVVGRGVDGGVDGGVEDGTAAVARSIRSETRLIWLESPGTMRFQTLDLPAIAALARDRGIVTVIDNSWATPLYQKPLESGIDLVVHSATKYLAGHSDVVAGALVGSRNLLERLFHDAYLLLGAALSPFDAYLIARGIRTLPVRMRRHHASGLEVARHLDDHPKVARVFHPGLAPEAATPHLRGYSGLFSFTLESGDDGEAKAMVDRLRHFRHGVSWGGVESLVLVPRPDPSAQSGATQSGATQSGETGSRADGLPRGLVRLSIGLEPPDRLIADLDRALGAA